jgi:L-amino acid N-acyltransferase YncA
MNQDVNSYVFRLADKTDISAIASLHVTTFGETHGHGPGNPTFQTRFQQWETLFRENDGTWFCIVIEDDFGALVGFAKGQPHDQSDKLTYSGELNKIYILRKYQHLGLGKKLMNAVAREFLSRKIPSMLLFGDAQNPSNTFYELLGADKILTPDGEFHGGYGWPDLSKLAGAI